MTSRDKAKQHTPLVFHPIYSQLELPHRHRFPIQKYQGIYDALCAAGVPAEKFVTPTPVTSAQLCQVFDPEYVTQLVAGQLDPKAMRRIGFPWSQQLIERSLTAVGGTVQTAQLAVEHGLALNLTGGYHHAFANYGSGFCLFNDLYLAALTLLQDPYISRVLVLDCDVHQGDGTARLAHNNNQVFTVSIHGEKNFPHRKQLSDMDFPLAKGTGDEEYLNTLDTTLHLAQRSFQPDAVLYDAGVDVHCDDDLGHLALTTQGVLQRDQMVLSFFADQDIPLAAVIGGGYQRDIDALVKVHLQLFSAAGLV